MASPFIWMYHRVSTVYPDASIKVQFGNSYSFTAPPSAPDQRRFILKYAALKYFTDECDCIDLLTNPIINLGALEAFYNQVKTYSTFIYKHAIYGELPVRFNRPLTIPEGEVGGQGVHFNIEVELIEVPGIPPSPEYVLEYVELP